MIGLLFGKHVVVESVDLNYGNQSRKSFFIWGVEEEESNSQTKSKNPNVGGTHPSRQALSMTQQRMQGGRGFKYKEEMRAGWKHPMSYTQLN